MTTKVTTSVDSNLPKGFLTLGLLFAITLRWCVTIYPHSGQGKPPMFGDYEAQRHWQEITLHIPIKEWYHNTTQNDLQYWGLDYPPLTAYHSLAMGHLADFIDPESVVLFASRGYETENHKLFMRWTVLLSDIYFYVPALIVFYYTNYKLKLKELERQKFAMSVKNLFLQPEVASLIGLIYPGLILIDHGHFQYNCVSLGLFVWAVLFVCLNKFVFSSIFFVMALNYKQMELYHSIPFFIYLLSQCSPTKTKSVEVSLKQFFRIAIAVILTFAILWFPFLKSFDSVKQVLLRIFPVARGVFEDKVASVWCLINVFIKLKKVFTNVEMAKICLVSTALAILPSSVDLFFRPNIKKFILSLINSSLAFFLFSFQVHEKTILLCAVPVIMHLPLDPVPCMWFLLVSNFSMLPLFIKDGLFTAYVSLSIIHLIAFSIVLLMMDKNVTFFEVFNITKVNNMLKGTKTQYNNLFYQLFNIGYVVSLVCMIVLSGCTMFVKPPAKYPDLYPLIVSCFSCAHFIMFFFYFNYCQFIIPKVHNVVIHNTKKIK